MLVELDPDKTGEISQKEEGDLEMSRAEMRSVTQVTEHDSEVYGTRLIWANDRPKHRALYNRRNFLHYLIPPPVFRDSLTKNFQSGI